MTIEQARAELEQYIVTLDLSICPARQWGFPEHEYAADTDLTSDPVTWQRTTTWRPFYGRDRIRVSRQLCLFDDGYFPSPRDYAAHCNWVKSIRALLNAKPARVPRPPKPTHIPTSLQANTWYWREIMPLLKKAKRA